jgi:hypothetical protein
LTVQSPSLDALKVSFGDEESIVDRALLASARETIEGWILGSDPTIEIAPIYRALLQTEPSVIVAHAQLRQSLASLPPPNQVAEGVPALIAD